MEYEILSEHRSKLRVRTILIMLLPTALCLAGITGSVLSLYMAITHELTWRTALILEPTGLVIGFAFGWVVVRFVRRMWVVKSIRVVAGQQLEITTRMRNEFTAKLPDDIQYMLTDRGTLTVAVRVGNHRFVIDSTEYSDAEALNQFLRNFVREQG